MISWSFLIVIFIIIILVLIDKRIENNKKAIAIYLSTILCKILFSLIFIFPILLFVIPFFSKTIFNEK
ncbi:hypothetical protein [Candidatus Hepatoplasma crinochetorum]|uniref:hypothetical protein n=1 Tax=Candidatus Hepatoplasma crinochetorum TaxID=295596 RepID=UPI003F658AC8